MWSALFGSGTATLILKPQPSAHTIAGFKGGKDLRIAADFSGQTVGQMLEKFNIYRGPDQQIHRIWDPLTDKEIHPSTRVDREMIGIVRADSVTTR